MNKHQDEGLGKQIKGTAKDIASSPRRNLILAIPAKERHPRVGGDPGMQDGLGSRITGVPASLGFPPARG